MTIERALTTAAGASGPAVYVEDVFSTYLYAGTGSSQTITNDVNLSTKGGLVWIKARSGGYQNALFDTARGATKLLGTNATDAETTDATYLTAFNSNGFSLGASAIVNYNAETYASWTFRKQAKFFDIVTYTGTGSATTIAHNLGSTPGMIMVKRTDTTGNWQVYHRSLTSAAYAMQLNLTSAQASGSTIWNSTAPTSSVFSIGVDETVNATGGTYVAYLFAHDAGGFGADGAESIIKCGGFTTNGSGLAEITLGWEPQFLLVKSASFSSNWEIQDDMRKWSTTYVEYRDVVYANLSDSEYAANGGPVRYTKKLGFENLGNNSDYIYLAIRRGPMKTPTDATKVFAPVTYTGSGSTNQLVSAGFPVDTVVLFDRGSGSGLSGYEWLAGARLLSLRQMFRTSKTTYWSGGWGDSYFRIDNHSGVQMIGSSGSGYNNISSEPYFIHAFRRAPGFHDVIFYAGTGSATGVDHGLGVAPELVICKRFDSAGDWRVWHKDLGTGSNGQKELKLNSTSASLDDGSFPSAPSSTVINLGTGVDINGSGAKYTAFMFASLAGISKVFSYTGNGSSQTINCGFSAGARYILIKRTDDVGDWYVWDTARGIVSGNDPHMSLNSTAVEVTTDDSIDPDSSGFIVNQVSATNINVSSATYIGLAIA